MFKIVIQKLKTALDIIITVKNWLKVFLVRFGVIKSAEITFRNGYKIPLNLENYGKFMGLVYFFRDFPAGKIENNLAYFVYKGRDLVFDFGNGAVGSFYRNEWGDFFDDETLKEKTVIDLGCSIGDTPVQFIAKGAKRVIGIEMLPYRYNLALKNISLNKMDDVCRVLNVAVGGKAGKMAVDITQKYSEHYSELNDIAKNGKETIEIPVITLEDIIESNDVKEGNVIKSDLQGGELEVFLNASDEIIRRFDLVVIRFYYRRDERAQELKARFESAGFKCAYFKPKVWGCGYLTAKKDKIN